MSKPLLQTQLEYALPELNDEDFGYYETDLHVRCTPRVLQWLEDNYEFFPNITSFYTELDGSLSNLGVAERWLDIPFAGKWPECFK